MKKSTAPMGKTSGNLKRAVAIFAAAIVALALVPRFEVAAESLTMTVGNADFTVNGASRTADVAPFIAEGRTMVSLRFIADFLGAEVHFDETTQIVNISLAETAQTTPNALILAIGEPLPNGLGTPIIQDGQVFVPLRFVAENFGIDVEWNAATATITITHAAVNVDEMGELDELDESEISAEVSPTSVTFITAATAEERNALWQADISQLRNEISRRHSMFWDDTQIFVPADILSENELEESHENGQIAAWNALQRNERLRNNALAAFDTLLADIPNLTDFEIVIAMQRAIAYLQDNHFQLLPWEIRANDVAIFAQFRHFAGEFFLTAAPAEFAAAINHKVVAINGVPINTVIQRFSEFVSVENIYDARTRLAAALNSPLYLGVLGLYENESATFTMENPQDGSLSEIIFSNEHRLLTEEDFERLGLAGGRAMDEMPAFFILDARNTFHFYEEYGLLYIRLEGFDPTVYSDGWELMWALGAETFGEIEVEIRQAIVDGDIAGVISPPIGYPPANWLDDEVVALWEVHPGILEIVANHEISAIVVDVRYNLGGDPGTFTQLFDLIRETVPAERLFYFINGGSLSASATTAFAMRAWGATLVGEPMGQNTIFHGVYYRDDDMGALVVLENSEIAIEIPNLLSYVESDILNLDFDYSEFFALSPNFEFYTIRPDVLIEHTIDDWLANRDPLLEFVFGILR
ncbi:MAG: stalk domain-containing protein [Turicibacter sp.]|nr:stalk domain-containing protein [Turicibacter sp.]